MIHHIGAKKTCIIILSLMRYIILAFTWEMEVNFNINYFFIPAIEFFAYINLNSKLQPELSSTKGFSTSVMQCIAFPIARS
jgi:hypothetical protein